MTRCTVIIPTWNAPDSIGAAIASALTQTIEDIEVLVVGDGVTDENRAVIEQCVAADSRVRFLDLPKGENRGERNRHIGVGESTAPAIAYLADDDLFLPRHLENILELLETVDLCQSLNGYITIEGELELWPTDLSQQRWRDWHLVDPPRNRVSITGTAHRKDTYYRLERGWDVAPPGMWTDLYLWRQFFRLPDLRAATHPQMTTLQFRGDLRAHMTAEHIRAQRAQWAEFVADPGAHDRLQELVVHAREKQLIELSAHASDLKHSSPDAVERWEMQAQLASLSSRVDNLTAERDNLAIQRAASEAEVQALRATWSWRITAPLRRLRSRRPRKASGS